MNGLMYVAPARGKEPLRCGEHKGKYGLHALFESTFTALSPFFFRILYDVR